VCRTQDGAAVPVPNLTRALGHLPWGYARQISAGRVLTVTALVSIVILVAGFAGVASSVSPLATSAITAPAAPPAADDVLLPSGGS
jgi:hypothetical protein